MILSWHSPASRVESALQALLPALPRGENGDLVRSSQSKLREAMRHAVFAGGKRMRSQLLMECTFVAGGDERALDHAIPFACALELIHAYSLVHDDLPAMDDADTRRGLPSCHKLYGEATAILVGDALQTLAFQIMAHDGLSGRDAQRELSAIRVIAEASGERGMVGGQQMDIDWSGDGVSRISEAQLSTMHALKTGALIRAACEAGARLATDNPHQIAALRAYGTNLGRAFQIHDDILDLEGDPNVTGKSSTDSRNLKMTAPEVYGLQHAKGLAQKACESAQAALSPFGERAETLRRLACYVVQREK